MARTRWGRAHVHGTVTVRDPWVWAGTGVAVVFGTMSQAPRRCPQDVSQLQQPPEPQSLLDCFSQGRSVFLPPFDNPPKPFSPFRSFCFCLFYSPAVLYQPMSLLRHVIGS